MARKRRPVNGDPFDHAAGAAAKADGIARADEHADTVWKQTMLEIVREVCQTYPWFNTDALERIRFTKHNNITTHEPRALGAVMLAAMRLGYCVPTQDFAESTQKSNHHRPMRTWFSLLYRGPGQRRRPTRRRVLDPRQLALWDEGKGDERVHPTERPE